MSKAKTITVLLLVAGLSSFATYGLLNGKPNFKAPADKTALAAEDYFTNDVFSDEQQSGKTVEAMVKRCESAEIILKAAGGQIVPALQPMSNEEAAKRLVEIGVCVGSLGTFAKVKFPGKVCLPAHHLSPVQVIRIFLQWAQNNPAKLEENFTIGYLQAFEEAFPCTKSQ